MECIKWRATIDQVGKDVYFNLWQDNCYQMSRYISKDTPKYDAVVKLFAEIIVAVYNVTVSSDLQWVNIPIRTEYDENGKLVHSLENKSFDESLNLLKQFIEQNGHLPFSASSEYECSLRRWLMEISHDIIPLTHTQHHAYEELMATYADMPKSRSQWEKMKEQHETHNELS